MNYKQEQQIISVIAQLAIVGIGILAGIYLGSYLMTHDAAFIDKAIKTLEDPQRFYSIIEEIKNGRY